MILAAGAGRRMGGRAGHKGLLEVGGRSLLGRLLDGLRAVGVEGVVVVTGHRAADIRAATLDRWPDARFVHNDRWADTNNVVSLALGLAALQEGVGAVVVECDLVLGEGVLELVAGPSGNVAVLDRYSRGMDGTVAIVEEGQVARLVPPNLQGRGFRREHAFKTLNLYHFEPGFWRDLLLPLLQTWASRVDPHCYYDVVLGVLVEQGHLRLDAALVDGRPWAEVDDPTDLRRARYLFEPERRYDMLDAWRGGHWNADVLDFTYPRNMYFPTEGLLDAMREALPAMLQGYGSKQIVIDEKLAEFIGCAPGRATALHGASQIYPLLPELFPCSSPLIPDPSFGEYERVLPAARTYSDRPGVDLDALENAISASDLVVVVNPNNPTGTTLPSRDLYALAARHPGRRFLVDESFIDFSGQPSLIELLEEAPLDHVVVLRSLSKALGVPGLRLGYAYTTDEAWSRRLARHVPIWNLSSMAEVLLELLPRHRAALGQTLTRSAEDREALAGSLAGLAAVTRVYPSGGNFMLVDLACGRAEADHLCRRLLVAHGLLVKDASPRFPGDTGRLRVAVRTPQDNERLVAAIRQELP